MSHIHHLDETSAAGRVGARHAAGSLQRFVALNVEVVQIQFEWSAETSRLLRVDRGQGYPAAVARDIFGPAVRVFDEQLGPLQGDELAGVSGTRGPVTEVHPRRAADRAIELEPVATKIAPRRTEDPPTNTGS